MSSHVSHLPPERRCRRIVGHGMNAEEVGQCSEDAACALITAVEREGVPAMGCREFGCY